MITTKDLQHASESTKRRNPALFGVVGLRNTKSQQNTVSTDAAQVRRQTRRKVGVVSGFNQKPGIRVTITSYRRRLLDSDNLQGGAKVLRDEIAKTFGLDDSERSAISWQYAQVKTDGKQGTVVMIERL